MALPTTYLTSTKRLSEILDAIKTAKAPEKFTQRFLESLEFKSKGDRLVIGLLKSLSFLDDNGKPTERYYNFLDQSQSAIVLAESIEEAYSDLFEVNRDAQNLERSQVVGKFKTLSQGQYSDSVINKMATTFVELCSLADFNNSAKSIKNDYEVDDKNIKNDFETNSDSKKLNLGGLVYNIQIVLPETRDPKVYDALFKSLKEHL